MFSMPDFANEKEFDKKSTTPSYIVSEIESKKYSVAICEWGCRAFANLSAKAMQNHSPELLAEFLDGGACEVLVSIMYKFSGESQIVACFGCATILHLAWSSRDLREFFGEIAACDIVVHSISMHIGDPDVSEYGSGAVGILSKNNISNSFKLTQAGACDVMVQVGNFGFCLRHPRCQNVAANVCFALAQFAEAVNCARLLECGACELITQLMRLHSDVERVIKRGVRAICAIASLNFPLREMLGQCGACELIIAAMVRYHTNVHVLQEGCEALMHLSLSPTNTKKIGDAGGCELIVNCLRDHLMEHFQGADVCCGAMINLVTYGTAVMDNRSKLIEAGATEQLKRAHMSIKASYRSREQGSQLMEILGGDNIGSGSNRSRNSSATLINDTLTPSSSTSTLDNNSLTTKERDTNHSPVSVESTKSGLAGNTYSSNGVVVSHGGPVGPHGRSNSFRGIVLGSEAKDGTIPLNVEVRVYETFAEMHDISIDGSPMYMRSPKDVHNGKHSGTVRNGHANGIKAGDGLRSHQPGSVSNHGTHLQPAYISNSSLQNLSSLSSTNSSISNSNNVSPIIRGRGYENEPLITTECDSNGVLEV
jgi:hypothetical protein